jgi:hypothetical protein
VDVVRFAGVEQVIGLLVLGMQHLHGDHAAGQIRRGQQRELGDLMRLAVRRPLREDGPGLPPEVAVLASLDVMAASSSTPQAQGA